VLHGQLLREQQHLENFVPNNNVVSVASSTSPVDFGNFQAFTAGVQCSTNTATTWTFTNAGNLDAEGNCTTPEDFPVHVSATVRATSHASNSAAASAKVTATDRHRGNLESTVG